jgi:hypothetical protein
MGADRTREEQHDRARRQVMSNDEAERYVARVRELEAALRECRTALILAGIGHHPCVAKADAALSGGSPANERSDSDDA